MYRTSTWTRTRNTRTQTRLSWTRNWTRTGTMRTPTRTRTYWTRLHHWLTVEVYHWCQVCQQETLCLAVKHQFKNQLSCCTREIKPFCEIVALICWGNCYRTSADWRNAFGNSVWPFCHLHHLHLVLDSPLISIFWSGSPQQHYVKCGASLKIFCFPFWNKDTRT